MAEPDPRIIAALREQLARQRALLAGGATRVGWKIALGIDGIEDRPVIGYLTSATLLEPGSRHSAAAASELCVDAEVAVVIGAGYAAALELVDLGQGRGSVESVIRENVLHRAVALGPAREADPEGTARVWVGDELRAERRIAFDLEERVAVARYWLSALGERLEPGDAVITGAIAQVPVAPGDQVAVELGSLGRLDVTITA